MVVRIEKMRVNVTVQGDATDGKKKVGDMFQEFIDNYEDREARSVKLAQSMANDRRLSPRSGRR